jgi:hypothetical protein
MKESALERLARVEKTKNFVFHGSGEEIEIFEPRQAYNYVNGQQIPDGKPAIFASPNFRYAMFLAIINERNCPNDFHSGAGMQNGKLVFRATQKTLDQLKPESKGYVYVFEKKNFNERDQNEYYSIEPAKAIEQIEVKYEDFDMPIQVIE